MRLKQVSIANIVNDLRRNGDQYLLEKTLHESIKDHPEPDWLEMYERSDALDPITNYDGIKLSNTKKDDKALNFLLELIRLRLKKK